MFALIITFPIMLVAIAVATIPLLVTSVREHRQIHHAIPVASEDRNDRRRELIDA
jgi:cell division septation protein DedD